MDGSQESESFSELAPSPDLQPIQSTSLPSIASLLNIVETQDRAAQITESNNPATKDIGSTEQSEKPQKSVQNRKKSTTGKGRQVNRRPYLQAREPRHPSHIKWHPQLQLKVRVYYIGNIPYTMPIPVPDNEETSFFTRKTCDGRTLSYELRVLQQPERARACGAGARSSADRRPVDPPPVVELRVFEVEGHERTDITLKHNATFILCASLENARPISNGRMHVPPHIASLQGVNFAGANYLDRPHPAGYFLFPDLSVRNEGWYRLNFSLFEGSKEPQDADPDRRFPGSPQAQNNGEPRKPAPSEDMSMRLDVKSRPFQVFSAKKFPGLSESTDLSRLVAEQGCRVRIRRDVRMRKHGDRPKEETGSDGRRSLSRFGTPETAFQSHMVPEKPRSLSRASMDGSQYSTGQYSAGMHNTAQYTPGPYQQERFRRPSAEASYLMSLQQSGQSSSPHAGPSPVPTFHGPITPAPVTSTIHAHSGHILPPVNMPNGFAVPQPRHSQDNGSYNYSSTQARNAWPSFPNPSGTSRLLTPDDGPGGTGTTPAVSSIHSLTNPTNGPAMGPSVSDTGRKQYNIPAPIATKRGCSPNTAYSHSQALKSGMRPDTVASFPQPLSGALGSTMEADPQPYNSDSDGNSGEGDYKVMKYKRANGALGRKPIPYQYGPSP